MERYKPPAFQFYVRDFLTDRAVVLMTAEELGAYIRLLCHAWLSNEPGVLLEHDCESMSGLEITRWSMCRAALARAFDTVSRPGYWVQKRLTATFKEMDRYRKQKQLAGLRGAESRWQSHGSAIVSPIANDSSASATASATALESETESKRLSVASLPDSFLQFWKAYPRKQNKAKALLAWKRIKPDAALLSEILASIGRLSESEQWRGGFIPHPTTFLNGRRWEDEITGKSDENRARIEAWLKEES